MDKAEGSGFFSRVKRFIRSGAGDEAGAETQFADLAETPGADAVDDAGSDRQVRELVERRRRNDFVRRREFGQLRQLRRKDGASVDVASLPQGETHASFFSTSVLRSQDERARTLRKIDEIEEQMSRQWWKTLPPAALGAAPPPPPTPSVVQVRPPPRLDSGDFVVSGGAGFAPSTVSPAYAATMPLADGSVEAARVARAVHRSAPPAAPGVAARQEPLLAQPLEFDLPGIDLELPDAAAPAPDFLPTAGSPWERAATPGGEPAEAPVPAYVHDAALEDAAVRFANADYAGAEASLLDLTAEAPTADNPAWQALFELYRAMGAQPAFETAAIDYAERFMRSPPPWYSLAQGEGGSVRASAGTAEGQAGEQAAEGAGFTWRAPVRMAALSVRSLEQSLARAAPPWLLDWSTLDDILPEAAAPLAAAFTRWAGLAQPIWMGGIERLHTLLRRRTPTGDAAADQAWWNLRLEALRVMNRPDDFEAVALDYCITYEVSPPSWVPAKCEFRSVAADGGAATVTGLFLPTRPPDSGFGPTSITFGVDSLLPQQQEPATRPRLAGELTGSIDAAIAALDEAAPPGAREIAIDCKDLVRMDFPAAGALVNWVADRHAAGQFVRLRGLGRLVAVFLHMLVITEHARLEVRAD